MKRSSSSGERQAQQRCVTTSKASAFYTNQVLHRLNPSMQEFIARQEMVFIATSDAHGACDCSFRAGAPGDVHSVPHLPPGMLEATRSKGGQRPEAWVVVNVEEAYIHCSKHVPLLKHLDKQIAWGTDDESVKGGDFFKVKPNRSRKHNISHI